MDDLDKLIPQPAELTVGGESLVILPLKVGRLPDFLRAISPVLQQLNAPQIDWLGLFIEHGDDLLQAVAVAVGKPRTWVDDLAADEAILLAAKVVEVNADFFTRTVLPRLNVLIDQVARGPAPSGSMPSSG
ncbi:hypothetical protein PP715_22545 [Ralstonia solanacearum]|uniref:Uncharacterized protein n=3 Tax=Ralstonia solanacearum TaxID=305 RepID=F6G2P1_RALS8|nr:DUF6631 family protein [Ralstonia solanacearum]AEG69791.1 conserved hypothetical protein [Ralstonia solanacearum Po82]AMP67974.1 hypothetical protein UW163_00030 [Ralstonia solanacearum]AMP68951.1 hypothetical protein UW163_05385 [Ralstonia solanacearum]AMP75122.1 hypothetical protein RALBFv3_13540 [Ralstonia solanacearum]AYB61260.1 hypothetical protein C2124_12185 [Ralstonia solanacearum]